uniref:Phospholipid-transporting ATPase n=2 Tax=Parascaris univalens TaxID=6257 RepID=A0A915BAB5_PARUN
MKVSELLSRCGGGGSGKRGRRKSSSLPGSTQRHLRANDRKFNEQFKYADNFIKTSKYNIITFLPKNLFEQFQRLANFYFLVLMILQLIPWISSIVWYSTAIPLFFVLAFSAAKDAYDDIQRHRSDSQVNNRISYVVKSGQLVEEKWMNVKVGDIIRMENDQFVAADLLLLSTSEPHGLCYIETAELDGETNLKARQALPETFEMGDKLSLISDFRGEIVCEAPNNRLNQFEGKLSFGSSTLALDNDKMLLRGCVLRNTRWCYGVVVFAGKDTKLMMNSGKTKFKRTSLDRFLNILIMGIVLFLIAMCLMCTILCGVWEWTTGRHFTIYMDWDRTIVPKADEKSSQQIAIIAFLNFFSYIILLNTVVPISLYVSVEIIRFVHSMWINFDSAMYYKQADIPARARTTTLNEELGQVQYIFSDKTGTLTQNIMAFKKCSINGRSYGDLYGARGEIVEITESTQVIDFSRNKWYESSFKFYDETLLEDTRKGLHEVTEFWRLLALCHTVMPERKNGKLEYQAQSPDEAALTSAARNFGFVFKSRTANTITIEVNGMEEHYDLLCILDFNNVRKRMSVIVRNTSGDITLYCKGADTMIMERISSTTNELLKTATNQHLDKFAGEGLRTLCVAWKKIDADYFADWQKRQKAAALEMYNRQEKLDAIYEEIEHDMMLLGATAIEDKLQDGVPETIAKLASANIKIWVLTGDKQETAINIGYSCRLLTENMREVFVIDGETEREVEVQLKAVKRRLEQTLGSDVVRGEDTYNARLTQADIAFINPSDSVAKPQKGSQQNLDARGAIENQSHGNGLSAADDDEADTEGFALVINGHSLTHALKRNLEKTFLDIGCLCQAVVCCRVTPLQKAMVVDLVRRHKKAVTLSVGDGANDVSMIKTAHIGVGISGQEGMQAVLASDYSIGQFRYLQRLLLVHGRWSYFRMAKFLRYFFYKNFSFTLTHFWYSFFSGYTAQTVYDPVFIASYNLFFTSLPVLAMGIFDQDVDDEYSLKYAKLYMPGQYNLFFNMRIFIYSVLHGIISSLVIFFIPFGMIHNGSDSSGRDMNDYALLAFTCFTALIIVVTGQIMFDTAYWTAFSHIVIWGSLLFYFALAIAFYEALPMSVVAKSQSSMSYGVAFQAMSSPQFWLSQFMISVILLLPVMANRFFWFDTHPSYADRLRMYKKSPKAARKEKIEVPLKSLVRSAATRRSRRGSLRSGYAFSHQQGFGDLIVKGKLFRQVDQLKQTNSLHSPTTKGDVLPISEQPPGLIGDNFVVSEEHCSNGCTENMVWNAGPSKTRCSTPRSECSAATETTAYQHSIVVNADEEPMIRETAVVGDCGTSFGRQTSVNKRTVQLSHAKLGPAGSALPNMPSTGCTFGVSVHDSTYTNGRLSRTPFNRKGAQETEV